MMFHLDFKCYCDIYFCITAGWVITDMTGGTGLVTVETSVSGMLAILEKDPSELQGTFHDYKNEVIPW